MPGERSLGLTAHPAVLLVGPEQLAVSPRSPLARDLVLEVGLTSADVSARRRAE